MRGRVKEPEAYRITEYFAQSLRTEEVTVFGGGVLDEITRVKSWASLGGLVVASPIPKHYGKVDIARMAECVALVDLTTTMDEDERAILLWLGELTAQAHATGAVLPEQITTISEVDGRRGRHLPVFIPLHGLLPCTLTPATNP